MDILATWDQDIRPDIVLNAKLGRGTDSDSREAKPQDTERSEFRSYRTRMT